MWILFKGQKYYSPQTLKFAYFFREKIADKNINYDNVLISYVQEVMMIWMKEECESVMILNAFYC